MQNGNYIDPSAKVLLYFVVSSGDLLLYQSANSRWKNSYVLMLIELISMVLTDIGL